MEQKGERFIFPQCKTSIGNNYVSITQRATTFACSMGFSAMADWMMWPPFLSHDQKWPRLAKCTQLSSEWLTLWILSIAVTECDYSPTVCIHVWRCFDAVKNQDTKMCQVYNENSKIWDFIWGLSHEDLKFEEKMGFEIWDFPKWFKSIYWMIWDLTMRFHLGVAHHCLKGRLSMQHQYFWSANNSNSNPICIMIEQGVTSYQRHYTVFQKKWRQNSNHYNYGISYQN